ncbi:hypothetical protein OROHE_007727 [Orobanche hederae]
MEERYKSACVGYSSLREKIIAERIQKGEENPIVARLELWEAARRNADGVIDDPESLQILEDVLSKARLGRKARRFRDNRPRLRKAGAAETLLAIKMSATKDKGKGKLIEEPEQTKKKFKDEKEAQEAFDADLAQKLHQEELEAKQQEKVEQDSIAQVRKNKIDFLVSQGFQKRRFLKMSYDEVNQIYEREYKVVQDSSVQKSSPTNAKRAGMSIEQMYNKKQKAAELIRVKQEHGDELEKKKKAAEKKTIGKNAEIAETAMCLEESSKNEERDGPET